ncbi:MAG TPA: hypothetical protein VEQ85_07135 [Lacipirellulaceae bacterium]|nr:hypothetical protein [Lacipirellulaceae bacterium]
MGSLRTAAACCLALAVGAPCAGCWEEVHYRGDSATAPQPLGGDSAVAEPAARAAPVAPTAGELFGSGEGDGDGDSEVPGGAAGGPNSAATGAGARRPAPATVGSSPEAAGATPAERRHAWTLASEWGLAAAARAKQLPPAQYAKYLENAAAAGEALGVPLPALPADEDPGRLELMTLEALRQGDGPRLAAAIGARVDSTSAAAAQLALEIHALLLAYAPADPDVPQYVRSLRGAAVGSGLPAELWEPLVRLVDERAEFSAVRAEVFALRQRAAEHLAEAAQDPGEAP